MSSVFGRKKQAAQQREQAQASAWRPRTSEPRAVQENVQAFYRITHTEPSRLERARMVREEYSLSA
jgi:hypothetical protein